MPVNMAPLPPVRVFESLIEIHPHDHDRRYRRPHANNECYSSPLADLAFDITRNIDYGRRLITRAYSEKQFEFRVQETLDELRIVNNEAELQEIIHQLLIENFVLNPRFYRASRSRVGIFRIARENSIRESSHGRHDGLSSLQLLPDVNTERKAAQRRMEPADEAAEQAAEPVTKQPLERRSAFREGLRTLKKMLTGKGKEAHDKGANTSRIVSISIYFGLRIDLQSSSVFKKRTVDAVDDPQQAPIAKKPVRVGSRSHLTAHAEPRLCP